MVLPICRNFTLIFKKLNDEQAFKSNLMWEKNIYAKFYYHLNIYIPTLFTIYIMQIICPKYFCYMPLLWGARHVVMDRSI